MNQLLKEDEGELQKVQAEREEQERLKQVQLEKERIEKEKLESERIEKERIRKEQREKRESERKVLPQPYPISSVQVVFDDILDNLANFTSCHQKIFLPCELQLDSSLQCSVYQVPSSSAYIL